MKSINLNNTLSLQIYQIIRYGMFFLSGIIFTRSGLSLSGIAEYETFTFIAGALSFFGISAIINATLSEYRESEQLKTDYFFNVFLFMLLFGSVLACIEFFIPQVTSIISGNQLGNSERLLIAVYLLISTPTYLLEYIYLLKNKPKKIVLYGIVNISLHCLFVIAPVVATHTIKYALYGLILSSSLKFIWVFLLIKTHSTLKKNYSLLVRHFKASAPLAAAAFFSGIADYIDGIIVANHFNKSTFTLFRYGARELPLSMLLANAMSISYIPKVVSNLETACKEIKSKSLQLMHILFPLSIFLMLISSYAYSLAFDERFNESAQIFNIYLLLIVSRLIFPQTLLIGKGKNKFILYSSVLEVVINVAFSLLFMQWFGILGVAFGTVTAFYFDKLFLVYFTRKKLKLSVNQYIPIKFWLIYSISLWLVYLIQLFYK